VDLEDMMFRIGEQFRIIDYMDSGPERLNVTNSRKGKRKVTESADGTGRYARARMPSDRTYDFALDATIRAAAPYQKSRDKNGMAIAIESQDMREKVRERRSGSTILFLVDASGSLGVRKRMEAVKGAMLSMLRDSYVKRDKIGMMVFRRSSAELVIPPTKSVEYSYRMLEELPTGGKTPLAEALERAASFMGTYARSHSGEKCHIVVLTDGRANVPISKGADANEEVLKLAESISVPNVKWIVIDASSGYIRFDNARKLAEKLEGTYLSIEDLNADKLANSVRAAVNM
jgi:magnesium chelatase subunit D